MAEYGASLASTTAQLFEVLHAARAPLITASICALGLSMPPQTREIYRSLAEDAFGNARQLTLSLAVLCLACWALATIARELLQEDHITRSVASVRRILPVLCAALVPIGLSVGLFLAAIESDVGTPPRELFDKMPELVTLLQELAAARVGLLLGGAVCLAISASLFVPSFGFRAVGFRRLVATIPIGLKHFVWLGTACTFLFAVFTVSASQFFGPIAIFLLAAIGVSSIAAALTRAGDRHRIPLLPGVVSVAVLLSLFDLNDNHGVQLLDSDSPGLNSAVSAFSSWYENRADREFYESRKVPYPVFIVAASGGGLYAADHAATVLARLQDRCANFAQHVFAISGVSGGSMGAALFASLAEREAPNGSHVDCLRGPVSQGSGPMETQVSKFMNSDFLSPILGAALFPDMIQQFFPHVLSSFDRAQAFEDAVTGAWLKLYPNDRNNPWSKPFLERWKENGSAPALILNSSNVEHGYRVAVTPFEIIDMQELGNIVPLSNLAEFHSLTKIADNQRSKARLRDISLVAAVSLSSRFPWVMPAGRLETKDGPLRLVDGGYVENSGTETVFDLVQVLERFYKREDPLRGKLPAVTIYLVNITNLQLLRPPGSFSFGEELSPIRAMLSTRETRAVTAQMRLGRIAELCYASSDCQNRIDSGSILLDLFDFRLPLGFLLAPSTRKIVDIYSGSASRAGTDLGGYNIDDEDKFARLGAYASNNDSIACKISSLIQIQEGRCG